MAGTDYATKSDVRALDQKLDATQADVRAIEQKLVATQADVRTLDRKVDSLDAKISRNGVFLERLESKVDAIIETLPAKANLSEVHALTGNLDERVSFLEDVSRVTSANVRKNAKQLQLLRNEFARVRKRANRK